MRRPGSHATDPSEDQLDRDGQEGAQEVDPRHGVGPPAGLPRRPNETGETLNQAATTSEKNRTDPEEQFGKAFDRENAGEVEGETGACSNKGYLFVGLGLRVR